jgi:signal-transduction protein with cAMP-binding, CBS, and nucleotidyltransferase domain
MTKEQRTNVMNNLFGEDGIVSTNDTLEFNLKSDTLCNEFPVFADYFNKNLKTRLFLACKQTTET